MSDHMHLAFGPLPDLVATASQLVAAGRQHDAEPLYRQWIEASTGHPQLYLACFNHACLLGEMGQNTDAAAALTRALALNPDFLPARINLGGLLERGGAVERALEQWRDVAQRMVAVTGPAITYKTTALRQMGRVLAAHQDLAAAEAVLRQCLELRPNQRDVIEQILALRLAQCHHPVLAPIEGTDRRSLLRGMNPLSLLAFSDDPLLQLGLAHDYARSLANEHADLGRHDRRDARIDLRGRRLRLGYVSSDLRDHAIGSLMAEVFELHDRGKVEVFAYDCGPHSDSAMQHRIRTATEHWVNIRRLDDDAAAARISADGIDILIDVNGHTRDARTAIFARRPAPIQVNWLGFPGTLGTPYHHYIIADDWIIPPEHEIYFSEAVVRLPCYQPNDRKRAIGAMPTRRDAGLPEDAFVFCCFNGSQKISRFTMARWLDILRRAPGSVLWLLDSGEDMRRNLKRLATEQGIAAERIIFAPKRANSDHLARYRLADLFLDSAPYGAHTTASDALWLGVPVLTLSGRSFAARVCGSLVRAAGLPDLVCDAPEAFIARAVALAKDRDGISQLRQRLSDNRESCDLFNMERLVDALETRLAAMVERHEAGATPQPNLQNLDAYLDIGLGLDHEAKELQGCVTYHDLYRDGLRRRDRVRPIAQDGRLWTAPAARRRVRKHAAVKLPG
ncbi:putative O-linked N-acetylglucosamine transferase (SPINDLY family) [Humitalea rosea]|uniref:protein O-GlcNAc transferase n=1 Tax=Humitalea rosea TaxID=990373 RepID=A0A2W7IMS6_9PROT|nr:N-acetylglucosamine transferase [Humitalea rosea]PZW48135.1 putative O-linked N-acetylglucosamine transferase (SPINDLY family) [Humitalea rosea]